MMNTEIINIDSYKAVAVIDSGVGGLTVVQELNRQLCHENIAYFGDTARMPYGSRTHEEVRRFTLEMIDFLQCQEIKMVVIACNSATAAGLSYYRQHCKNPIVGVIEPGVQAAIKQSRNGRIGVIGTVGTINSSEYLKALLDKERSLHVVTKACPLFVLLVENNLVETPEARKVAHEYLDPLLAEEIDTLILGCTHYPLMTDLIQDVVGPSVKLINSAEEVAVEVKSELDKHNLANPINHDQPHCRFFVSGDPAPFEEVGAKLLGYNIKAYRVQLS